MWLYHRVMSPNDADGMANSVDPDQTVPLFQSDLGLHCLPMHISPKTLDHYGTLTRYDNTTFNFRLSFQ